MRRVLHRTVLGAPDRTDEQTYELVVGRPARG